MEQPIEGTVQFVIFPAPGTNPNNTGRFAMQALAQAFDRVDGAVVGYAFYDRKGVRTRVTFLGDPLPEQKEYMEDQLAEEVATPA